MNPGTRSQCRLSTIFISAFSRARVAARLVLRGKVKPVMAEHMFVDESKARSYVLAGVICPSDSLGSVRKLLTGFLLPGQTRLHFSKERAHRKSVIIQSLLETQLSAVIIETPKKPSEIEARARVLRRLVRETQELHIERLIIEQDSSTLALDRRIVSDSLSHMRQPRAFGYTWLLPQQEPLLWAADAYAWAWSAGKQWKSLVRSTIRSMTLPFP
jgi:hypothetical protein